MVITWIYVFTVIIVITFAIERSKRKNALSTIIKRRKLTSDTILVTNWGYEGYDTLTFIDSPDMKLVCRAKNGNPEGIICGFHLPKKGEYDFSFGYETDLLDEMGLEFHLES